MESLRGHKWPVSFQGQQSGTRAGMKLCNVNFVVKTKYVSVLSMAIKIVEMRTHELPPILGFTTLGVMGGCIIITCFLVFFYRYNI